MLDLQHINSNMYFEFYLNDSYFYRYNLDCDTLDISLQDLSYYLTSYLYKEYQNKRVTGHSYHLHSIVKVYLLIDLHPNTADIEQTDELSQNFSLDFHLSEKQFTLNLYSNLLLLTADLVGIQSFLEESKAPGIPVLACSNNIFWKLFPVYDSVLDTLLNEHLKKNEQALAKCRTNKEKRKENAEELVITLSESIDSIQEESTNVLNCCDDIMDYYGRYTRKLRYYPTESKLLEKELQNPGYIPQKTRLLMNYFQGKFGLLNQQQLSHCNKFMASLLFLPHKDDYQMAKEKQQSFQGQVIRMVDCRNRLINQLNNLQDQAIQIWQQ